MRDFGDWFANPNRPRPAARPATTAAPADPELRERVLAAIQRARNNIGLYAAPHSAEYEREVVGAYLDAIEDELVEIFDAKAST